MTDSNEIELTVWRAELDARICRCMNLLRQKDSCVKQIQRILAVPPKWSSLRAGTISTGCFYKVDATGLAIVLCCPDSTARHLIRCTITSTQFAIQSHFDSGLRFHSDANTARTDR